LLNNSQALGIIGEELAGHFLVANGYKLLLKNYECFCGEIDIIAKDQGVLAFIEVKTRSSLDKGVPAEAVTFHKRKQIIKSAQFYLKRYGIKEPVCRFDVVSVMMLPGTDPEVEIIKDAFGLGD
jgi:putative endonuclease